MARVVVVGAGVVGLTCAVRLLEAGHRVDVVARDLPLETTSVVAGALVGPEGAAAFAALSSEPGDTGVRLLPGTDTVRGEIEAPVVDMPVYLRWLVSRVDALDGTLTRLNLSALPEHDGVVVNCSGLGARLLGQDPTVVPVAGQVVVVEQVGLARFWADGDGPSYVVPREREVVVGGNHDEGEWSRTPSPEVAERILDRAREAVPELAEARVLRHRVGLRPARPAVRLERRGRVVHCYGHGDAGVTLSWGSADEVAALVERGD